MSVQSLVNAGRTAHERLMIDTCVIKNPALGEPTLDPDSGTYGTPLDLPVYSGPCRVKVAQTRVEHLDVGERIQYRSRPVLDIPSRVTVVIHPGATVVVGALTYRVMSEETGSTSTARLFVLEQVSV